VGWVQTRTAKSKNQNLTTPNKKKSRKSKTEIKRVTGAGSKGGWQLTQIEGE